MKILLQNGRVLDPASGLDKVCHLALAAGRILTPADLIQPDGLHPTAKGVALIVEGLGPKVLDLIARAGQI